MLNEIPIELEVEYNINSRENKYYCQVSTASCSYMQYSNNKKPMLVKNTAQIPLHSVMVISNASGFRRPTYMTAVATGTVQ